MALYYSLPTQVISTKSVLRGCTTVKLTNSIGKDFNSEDKKVFINISISSSYLNYKYGCFTRHVKRLYYKNSKCCANIEVAKVEDFNSMDTMKTPIEQLKAFYAFTRPYACKGVILSIVSSSFIAIEKLSDISLPFLVGLLKVAAAFGCLIVYVNGVNQLFDIEIDKINKPYLPLASGDMTIETGASITSTFALMAFAIGISVGSIPILWGIFLFFAILSAYSVKLPFLRWKNSAIGSGTSILTGYAIVCPVATYLYMQISVFGRQANFPKTLAFGTIIMSVFYAVIALFKDIPDIEGDRKFGVRSLATSIGPKKVFWICVYLIQIAFTFAIFVGATSSYPWSKLLIITSHIVLSTILWKQARSTNFQDEEAMQSFYMFIWKLLYAEYLLIPLIR